MNYFMILIFLFLSGLARAYVKYTEPRGTTHSIRSGTGRNVVKDLQSLVPTNQN